MDSLEIVKLHPNAIVPTYATAESAALDLYADEDCEVIPGEYRVIKTGIAARPPPGHYIRIASRSGLTLTCGFTVGAGVVDRDYRGEICVLLTTAGVRKYTTPPNGVCLTFGNCPHSDILDVTGYKISRGTRIAQMIVEKYTHCVPLVVAQLSRDAGAEDHVGFGSTGTK